MSYAKIELKLFQNGMLFSCEEADIEEIIQIGDGMKLNQLINDVEDICNPNTTYVLNEFGEKIHKRNHE